MINLDALSELEARATKGPWAHYDNGFDGGVVSGLRDAGPEEHTTFGCGKKYDIMIFGGEPSEGYVPADDPDVIFIAASRNALPGLIAELRAARAVLDWIGGIPQDAIFEAPEVWGCVLESARTRVLPNDK